MAQFLGYLLKCGTNTDNSFIQKDTFESTPNQREEINIACKSSKEIKAVSR